MSDSKETITVKQGIIPAEATQKFRRIITGHDKNGKAVILEDGLCPNRFVCGGVPTFVTNEMWVMNETPGCNAGNGEDTASKFSLNPPLNGNVFRLLEIPPDSELGVRSNGEPVPPTLHRTSSTDYAFVVSGEVYAVLDDGVETLMKAGDSMIQRGTHHAWSNRSGRPCVVLFVLCGAEPIPGLPTD